MSRGRVVLLAAASIAFVLVTMVGGFNAAERVDASWLWVADAVAIALPAMVAAAGRFGVPRPHLVALLVWPFAFAVAGSATLRLALEFLAARRVFPALGVGLAVGCVFVAWGCQVLAVGAAMKRTTNLSRLAEAALMLAVRQGPWAAGVGGAFGAIVQLHALFPEPSMVAAAIAVIAAAILCSYLCALAGSALLSTLSGPEPERLRVALADLRDRSGATFSKVVYLDRIFVSGVMCEVRPHWRGSALVVNRRTVDMLSGEECLAVLAHEAGHLRQRYLAKQVLANAMIAMTCAMAIGSVAGMALSVGPLAWSAIFGASGIVSAMAHGAFRRRLERDADAYAVRIAGAEPLVGALAKLSPPVDPGLLAGYDSFGVRAARARSVELS